MSSDTLITIKDRIIQHIHFLKERMEPDFGLLNAMHANGIIDWRYKMAVESRNSSRERNYKLLNYILDRDQCDELVKALTDSDQMHIANYLTSNGVYSDDFGENWPLAEKQISILNINHRSFVDLLDLTDLLGLLYSSKIINSMQKESISSKPTSHEKNNALLGILRRRSVCDYKQTIKCLHESKQSHIATVLECCGVIVLVHASLDGENVTETENEISTAIANMIINDRSSDEADQIQAAGRILGLAMVKVIAAKKGQSVVLYIYCKTIEDLQQLHDYLISGQLKDSVELWFNSLLIRSQKTKVAALTTDFEEFQKMRTYFKDEEIRINSLKRNYSEESEVTDNLQKKQRMPLATEEDCQPSTTTLNELPLELLDAILMSSLLHRMLHSSTHQRDEDIIRTLTSVDFCWFQRITKRRFKKRSWKQLKDFYGKTRKRFAIIRNNRNYLLANIKLDSTLIDSLLSVNCLTKEQIHYIQRQRSNRLRNIELLRVMRSFDVTKFSIFVTCLRKANQKTVARIMENGGGVMKVDVQNNHGANCTTYKKTQLLLHQNIEDRRNRIKPCSLQSDKLISQLNDEGIEILNSQLERETVLVWIWCRSQAALEYIQRLYESNQLRRVLYGVADIQTLTEIEESNVITIEDNQFKKTIVGCPNSINITQRIYLRKCGGMIGITKLRNEIYIMAYRSFVPNAMELNVFEDRIPFRLKKKMEMNQFEHPDEMVSCEKESCIFVCALVARLVWKISIETEKQHEPIKWLTFDYDPWGMSMTSDGELLIINESSSSLMIYGPEATLLRSIQLPTYVTYMCNAVETSIGNFIIINEEYEEEKEEEEDADEEQEGETGSRQRKHEKKLNFFVREFTSDGQTVIRNFVPSNETQQLKNTVRLSIDSDDQVFAFDVKNERVILLDSDLKWKCILCQINKEEPKIHTPHCFCYDEKKKQLIVGFSIPIGANVYNLSRN